MAGRSSHHHYHHHQQQQGQYSQQPQPPPLQREENTSQSGHSSLQYRQAPTSSQQAERWRERERYGHELEHQHPQPQWFEGEGDGGTRDEPSASANHHHHHHHHHNLLHHSSRHPQSHHSPRLSSNQHSYHHRPPPTRSLPPPPPSSLAALPPPPLRNQHQQRPQQQQHHLPRHLHSHDDYDHHLQSHQQQQQQHHPHPPSLHHLPRPPSQPVPNPLQLPNPHPLQHRHVSRSSQTSSPALRRHPHLSPSLPPLPSSPIPSHSAPPAISPSPALSHHPPPPSAPALSASQPQPQAPPRLPSFHHFDRTASADMQSHPQYHQIAPTYQPQQYAYQPSADTSAVPPLSPPFAANGPPSSLVSPIPVRLPAGLQFGGGAKAGKEIKRRTKTGCLTCRKRRIKCDETHPHCRNCAKSKRECMGYDPIFKQQPSPALDNQPVPALNAQSADQYSFAGFATSGFIPGSNPSTISAGFEYGPASLDPTMSMDSSLTMAHPSHLFTLLPSRTVRPISMEHLFSLQGVPPQYQRRDVAPPMTLETQQEVRDFYRHHYGPGLDKLFETTWYTTYGLAHLQDDILLRDFVSQCSSQFKSRGASQNLMRTIQSLEARLVWMLATMPRTAASQSLNAGASPEHPVPPDLIPRIDTIENLLTGQFLAVNTVPPPPQASDRQSARFDERTFWHHLARFTSARDNGPDATVVHEIKESLAGMRSALNLIESRDVLYSIAVARHFGGRLPDFNRVRHMFRNLPGPGGDDDITKLAIATDWIIHEDQRGQTQVVQTLCRMAIRNWALQQ